MTFVFVNAAEALEGVSLASGWVIGARHVPAIGSTGGNFSVGYSAHHPDGRTGFVKALNLADAMVNPDPARALQFLTQAYNYERDLLLQCRSRKMSKVVGVHDHGVHDVAPGTLLGRANYIIFEAADGDIRGALNTGQIFETAVKLRSLHNSAAGLRQLHAAGVAHQDLKPSNILTFNDFDGLSKIGDLGRASDGSNAVWHDQVPIAGDQQYAPPEQLYKATPVDFSERRLACDLYQLGSLIAFYFTGLHMNALLSYEVDPDHHWVNWTGTYREVLPTLRDAFGRCMGHVRDSVNRAGVPTLASIVEYLCDPEPGLRGDAVSRRSRVQRFDLQRTVTTLDLLSRRAAL